MQRDVRSELIVAVIVVVGIIFTLVFASLLSSSSNEQATATPETNTAMVTDTDPQATFESITIAGATIVVVQPTPTDENVSNVTITVEFPTERPLQPSDTSVAVVASFTPTVEPASETPVPTDESITLSPTVVANVTETVQSSTETPLVDASATRRPTVSSDNKDETAIPTTQAPTFTATSTPTRVVPSATPTLTATNTPTVTATLTPTVTASHTSTVTPSHTPTVTPSRTLTVTPSHTPTVTPSHTPTVTPSRTPTVTPSRTPTVTPSITPSPTLTPTEIAFTGILPTPPPTPTVVPIGEPTREPSTCERPANWVNYTVESGNTLFAIAIAVNSSLDELRYANCINDVDEIITGDVIFVPRNPVRPVATIVPSVIRSNVATLGCQDARTQMTSPIRLQRVVGTLPVYGSATRDDFLYYKIEIRPDSSSIYNFYLDSSTPVTNGLLGQINTSIFDNGLHWIRLTVVDRSANIPAGATCEIPVIFD